MAPVRQPVMEALSKRLADSKMVPFFVALLALAVTSISFRVPFYLDDYSSVIDYPPVYHLRHLLGIDGFLYTVRYVGTLSFAVDLRIWGRSAAGYHLASVLLHAANAVLVYYLVRIFVATERDRGDRVQPFLAATIASLVFALHPIQTQAVAYVSQRVTVLATTLYLLSMLAYVGFRKTASPRSGVISYLLSLLFAALAYKSKEFTITLPLVIILMDRLVVRPDVKPPPPWVSLLAAAPFALLTVLVPVAISGGDAGYFSLAAMEHSTRVLTSMGRWDYLITELPIIVGYLRMFFWPSGLSIDHAAIVHRSLFDGQVFFSAVLLGALATVGLSMFFSTRNGLRNRTIGFFILFTLIGFIVESGAIPIVDLVFEHRTYLPMFGFSALSGIAIARIFEKAPAGSRKFVAMMTVIVIVAYGLVSYERIGLWAHPARFWHDVLAKNPKSYRAKVALGTIAYEDREYDEAIRLFSAALSTAPRLAQIYYNIGLAQEGKGDVASAAVSYDRAITLDPSIDTFYLNRGVVSQKLNDPDRARAFLLKSVSLNPDSWIAYYDLGRIDLQKGDPSSASRWFDSSIAHGNRSALAYVSAGEALMMLGRYSEAARRFEQALAIDPGNELARKSIISLRAMQAHPSVGR